jgi:IS1 family transposase
MSTTDTVAQAGWYAVGGGRERYWDGWAWTERVRPVPRYVRADRHDDLLARLARFAAPMELGLN